MNHHGYAVPSFPPPGELVQALAARVIEAMAGPLGMTLDELRGRVGAALDTALHDHVHAVEDRLLRAERLANVGQLSAGVAHELRNPLSVIETSVFILTERMADDARAQRHLQRISQQVGAATEIVNDLLDHVRDRPVDRAPVDVPAVVREAVAQVPRAPEVALDLDLPDVAPRVRGDARRLRQVFINLLSNAYQAVAVGGRAAVAVRTGEEQVTVTVRDHGPGIPAALLPRLFEPLVSTRRHGVGLGLALSRGIVEAHGGALTAANDPDGGAVFTVTLPVVPPQDGHGG